MAGLTVIDNPAQLAEHLEAAAAVLRQTATPRDWLDQLLDADGDALKSDEAGFIADVHPDTMRRRAEAAAAAGKPIGILLAGAMWIFSLRRLLDAIEAKAGLPTRLEAETRARKSRDLRSSPHISAQIPIAAAG
jgi:hypothetical protein